MNIYISHSGSYDYQAELYSPIRGSALAKSHRFFLPHEPENMDTSARDELTRSDVVIAEVSLPSTGQGIELGLATAAGVPIICIYHKGERPSQSLRFIADHMVEYEGVENMLSVISDAIAGRGVSRHDT